MAQTSIVRHLVHKPKLIGSMSLFRLDAINQGRSNI